MSDLSTALIAKALDGLSLRSEAIAQNIANANSPGYRPVAVSFEASLRAAAAQGLDAVRNVTAEVTALPVDMTGGEVRLDLEMANASQTALRYSALVDVLSRQLQIHHAIVRGGQ
jgi:flagellar basal-body rod protein FlgB